MKRLPLQRRTLALLAVVLPLFALFIYVALRSGPMAPIAVTTATVESRSISPALFGIGTVEARFTYQIGPTYAARIKQVEVDVGDRVVAGQVLGELEPVDLGHRLRSQEFAFRRAEATLREAKARQEYARDQAVRYKALVEEHLTSEENYSARVQELRVAEAAVTAAEEDLARARSDREALAAQMDNLQLVAPVDGVIVARDAEPGTTVVAGQTVLELIDPQSLWINARFDQVSSTGLAAGLPAQVVLRSQRTAPLPGKVERVEPKADAVTEETLAKILFTTSAGKLPPVGELAEVTVDLQELAPAPVIPNAAIHRRGDTIGVWQVVDGEIRFAPITLGAGDLNGQVQVRRGLNEGDVFVLYSEKALDARSRIQVVERIPGISE